jgi:hypothetical protein
MQRQDLERMTREQLIAHAERLGIPRPRVLTQPELVDEIIGRTTSERERTKARGWLGRARDLLAKVVEKGLHLPEAARALRQDEKSWPAPPPPLPTVTLAEIYAAQGHLDRAIGVLDEVLGREPDHREARSLRERFVEQIQRSRARAGRVEVPPPPPPPPPKATKPKESAPKPTEATTPRHGLLDDMAAPTASSPNASPAAPEATTGSAGLQEVASEATDVSSGVAPTSEEATPGSSGLQEVASEATDISASLQEVASGSDGGSAGLVGVAPEATDASAALQEVASGANAIDASTLDEPDLPNRYEVDEVVAIAVDPRTIYLYWEVRPTTLAGARAAHPDGSMCVRVACVTASWEGPLVETRDLPVDALYGDRFVHDIRPGANVRVSLGWKSAAGFEPLAVGAELTAPRAVPVESVAEDVARWEETPVAPFTDWRPEAMTHGYVEPPSFAPFVPRSTSFERPRAAAASTHDAPIDTGSASWNAASREGREARVEIEEHEIVLDGPWLIVGGSSELSRGPGRRHRIHTVHRLPGLMTQRGGASELSR